MFNFLLRFLAASFGLIAFVLILMAVSLVPLLFNDSLFVPPLFPNIVDMLSIPFLESLLLPNKYASSFIVSFLSAIILLYIATAISKIKRLNKPLMLEPLEKSEKD